MFCTGLQSLQQLSKYEFFELLYNIYITWRPVNWGYTVNSFILQMKYFVSRMFWFFLILKGCRSNFNKSSTWIRTSSIGNSTIWTFFWSMMWKVEDIAVFLALQVLNSNIFLHYFQQKGETFFLEKRGLFRY